MKILHCLFTQGFAGTERYVAELATWQARRHSVALLVAGDCRDPRTGADIRDHVGEGVEVVTLPAPSLTLSLGAALWRSGASVIHAHLGRACHRAVWLPRPAVPLVATLHRRFKPSLHGRFDGVICIADWQRRDIPDRYTGAVSVINNWTRPAPAVTGQERSRLRADLGVGPGQFLIGAAGRLIREKGLDVLLAAFAEVREAADMADARLVVFGAGAEEAALRRMAPPGVIFGGFRHDLPTDMAALDGFVLASRTEPFGLVLLEAMAAGLPVVATRSGGPSDILGPDHELMVDPDDVPAMAAALRRLTRAGRVAYDLGRFSLEGQAAHIEAFYRDVIARQEEQQGLQPWPDRPRWRDAKLSLRQPDAHRLSFQSRTDASDRP